MNLGSPQIEGVIRCPNFDSNEIFFGADGGTNRISTGGNHEFVSPQKNINAYLKEGSLGIKSGAIEKIYVFYPGYFDSVFFPGVNNAHWSPDGKYIVFDFRNKIYLFDIANKRIGLLTKGAYPSFYISDRHLTVNGQTIYLSTP